jgi:hypothetical protein
MRRELEPLRSGVIHGTDDNEAADDHDKAAHHHDEATDDEAADNHDETANDEAADDDNETANDEAAHHHDEATDAEAADDNAEAADDHAEAAVIPQLAHRRAFPSAPSLTALPTKPKSSTRASATPSTKPRHFPGLRRRSRNAKREA